MIIPIAAGIAAAVSKAFTPPNALNMIGATDRYLIDVEQHAREFENLVSKGSNFLNSVMERDPSSDAPKRDLVESAKKETVKEKPKIKPPPLPKTDEPLTLLGLDVLYPPSTFDEIKSAYKQTVKLYHPDVILTPDASDEEKERASADFSRINSAFGELKKREEAIANAFSYDAFENGDRVTKTSSMYTSQQYEDPYRINYDRIRMNAEYNSRGKRMWYDEEYYYGPPIESQQAQRERWWNQQENDYVYEYDDVNYYQARSPSGFARQQGFAYNGQTTTNSFETGRSHYTSRIESYPYRDRHWSDRHVFDEVRFSKDQYNYYQSRDGYDRFREKWWDKGHNEYESNLNGEFGP